MLIPGLSLPVLEGADLLSLTFPGVTLGGYAWWQSHVAPALLLLHGWGQDASDMEGPAQLAFEAGWHAVSFSQRGWRGSSGCDDYGLDGHGDVVQALDWLAAQPLVSRVGLLGFSMGGLSALLAASKPNRAALVVAVNAPTDLRRVADTSASGVLRKYYDAVFPDPQAWGRGSPMTHAGQVQSPCLLILGGQDTICLPEIGREYARAAGADLLEIQGMGHLPTSEQWRDILKVATEFSRVL